MYLFISLLILLFSQPAAGEDFQIGSPSLREIWVDYSAGSDSNDGASRSRALRTVTAAWARIPQSSRTEGFRIRLVAGEYPESALPNYWENRRGSFQRPVIFEAADGRGSATFRGDVNLFNSSYIYFVGVNIIPNPAGDAFHCERCEYILLRNVVLSGGDRAAHETIKINQSQHIYIENAEISGAGDNVIDFVAVQYGHVINSRIHNAGDWCVYAKGGSAYLRFEGNTVYNCGTGGITMGQGTGFEFMESPWLRYEAYDMKVVNNIVHDTEGAGLGVNGGFNILLAHNTLYRVGSRSHVLEVVFGERTCDGDTARCSARRSLGGWGPIDTSTVHYIGNRNVYVFNNLIYNPAPFRSAWQHLAVYGPRTNSAGSPSPAIADDNLLFRGNLIHNGDGSLPLGVGDNGACESGSCTVAQILSQNSIQSVVPQLSAPDQGNFSVIGSLPAPLAIPDFTEGEQRSNAVLKDAYGNQRGSENNLIGALVRGASSPLPPARMSGLRLSKRSLPARGGIVWVTGFLNGFSSAQLRVSGQRSRVLPADGGFSIRLKFPRNRSRRSKRYAVTIRAVDGGSVLSRRVGVVSVSRP
jgi:hypothetical protein